jgi:hypothetical protein
LPPERREREWWLRLLEEEKYMTVPEETMPGLYLLYDRNFPGMRLGAASFLLDLEGSNHRSISSIL